MTKDELVAALQELQDSCDAKDGQIAQLQKRITEDERKAKQLPKIDLIRPTYQDEASAKDSRRPPAIHSVLINSTDGFAPPLKVLDLTVVVDALFLTLRSYSEDHETVAMTRIPDADIVVDLDSFLETLMTMRRDDLRMKGKKWG